MRRISATTCVLLLGIAAASAQPFPQNIPDHSVIGRLGSGTGQGPWQAIPFATLSAQLSGATITLNTGNGLTAPGAMSGGNTYTLGGTSDTVQMKALGLGGSAPATALEMYNAAVAPTGNGQAVAGASSANGGTYGGQGSLFDSSLINNAGSVAVGVSTGTQNAVFNGTITAGSLDTAGTIGGSLCRTAGGDILYKSGVNCFSTSGIVVAGGKTVTFNNTLTFNGTDSTTFTLPGANDTIPGVGATNAFTGSDTFSGAFNCTGTCELNGTAFGTFATQNYATPPAIGGTTPNSIAATTVTATTPIGLSSGGTNASTAAGARSSTGLNIDALTSIGDTNATLAATTRVAGTSASFTAARTWTLPAASAVNAGQTIFVADFAGGVSNTNTLTIQRAGSDTINGATSVTINTSNGAYLLIPNGVNGWTAQALGASATVGVASINGQTGNPSIVAGTNISVSTSGGNITITDTAPIRTKLSGATNYYVSTAGTDSAGCGTLASPCATEQFLFNQLLSSVDVSGQTVTVNLAAGTYTSGVNAKSALVGQNGAGGLIFTGPCTSGHTSDVIIQPTTQINSYLAANGAAFTIQCQKIDHSKIMSLYGGADMVTVSQNSVIYIGNQSLFGVRGDVTFGCNVNQWNIISGAFSTGIYFFNDFTIDTSGCSNSATVTTTNLSGTLTAVTSVSKVHAYMGVVGAGIPYDAYVSNPGVHFTASGSGTNLTVTNITGGLITIGQIVDGPGIPGGTTISSQTSGTSGSNGVYVTSQATTATGTANMVGATSNTIIMACINTSPCQATASATGVTISVDGGGQNFLDLGSNANAIANTNGDPSYSIIATLPNYTFFTGGFVFINDVSNAVLNGITFVNAGLAHGVCGVAISNSVLTTGQGVPYFPCRALNSDALVGSVSVTAGSPTFTVSSATGINIGDVVTDISIQTCTWTAGSATLTCGSGSGTVNGMKVQAAGILSGATISSGGGTTSITVGGCGAGPRCVTGSPTYLSETSVSTYFTNGLLDGSCVVTGISGTTITVNSGSCIKTSGTISAFFQGKITRGAQYEYLLRRDLDPSGNDNSPVFIDQAA